VGPGGSQLFTFDTTPPANQWSTAADGAVGGSAGAITDIAGLTAAVQTRPASFFASTVGSSGTVPPSTHNMARRNTTLNAIQTVPTGTSYTALMATLRNDTGTAQSILILNYDLLINNAPGTIVVEEIRGYAVYYSLTGEAGSWQLIPELSNIGDPGEMSAILNLGSWAPGSLLYILWVDDNGSVGRSNTAGANTEGAYLIDNVVFSFSADPVSITAQPTSQTAVEGGSASFTVAATGMSVRYQWHKVGAGPIPGATSSTLTINPVTFGHAGEYFVVVSNVLPSQEESQRVTLTVQPDVTPPTIVSAVAHDFTRQTIRVLFSEPVDQETAIDAVNYGLSGGNGITAASLLTDTRTVILTTEIPMVENTPYILTVSGVKDRAAAGNQLQENTTVPFSFEFTRGFVLREFYGVVPRQSTAVAEPIGTLPGADEAAWQAMIDHPRYPHDPHFRCYTNRWELNSFNAANNYGSRMSALFLPPVTGEYTFYLAADDHTRLYLSPDADPANKVELTRIATWSDPRTYTGVSAPVLLQAGERYYLETIQKEGSGGDHAAVHVQFPGAPTPGAGTAPTLAEFFAVIASPQTGTVEIAQHPQDTTALANAKATFTAAGAGSPASGTCGSAGVIYQWFRNGIAIPGATGPTYTTPYLSMADNGAVYRVEIAVFGKTLASNPAVLTVLEDTVSPRVIGVEGGPGDRVIVTFSERMNPTTLETFEFIFTDGIQAESLHWAEEATKAIVKTTPQTPGAQYTLFIVAGEDLSENPIDEAANGGTFRALASQGDRLLREWYLGLSGPNNLGTLTNNAKFPNNPDRIDLIAGFNSPQTSPDLNNYGLRVTGYIIPSETGLHQFQVLSDDSSLVWLSTGMSRTDLREIARENGCCSPRNGPMIFLEAGVPYYIEGIMQEGSGGDYFTLSWAQPTTPGQFVLLQGENTVFFAINLDELDLAITQHPASATVQEHQPVTFTAQASSSRALALQWQVSSDGGATFTDIPGATGTSYTIQFPNSAEHHNRLYRLSASSLLLTVHSNPALLTLTPDVVRPTVSYVVATSPTSVAVVFSEPMHEESDEIFAYDIPGVTISGVTFDPANRRRLNLTISSEPGPALTLGQTYQLTINVPGFADDVVRDPSGNVLNPSPATVSFVAQNFTGNLDATTLLPSNRALPLGSLTDRGFQNRIVRNAGIASGTWIDVGEAALAGTLIDRATGLPYVNLAPVPEFIETGIINYEQTGTSQGRIPGDVRFPGLTESDPDNFALEALTYLELFPGIYHMGVNSDDGFRVRLATGKDDPEAIILGEFAAPRGATDTLFAFIVMEAGLYPFRLTWQENAGGANVEWWFLDPLQTELAYVAVNADDRLRAFLPPAAPDVPVLSIQQAGGNVVISWTPAAAGFVLQSTADLGTPWQNVSAEVTVEGGVASVTVPIEGAARFYQLVRP
jgi:hypothetical protein